ncbi:hypothetical protein ABZ806_31070 [Spirillospora sp. NPDC047418]
MAETRPTFPRGRGATSRPPRPRPQPPPVQDETPCTPPTSTLTCCKPSKNIRTLAERADHNAIDRLLTQPSTTGHLDDHTLGFLRRAQDLIFITTQTLMSFPPFHGHPI